MEVVKRKGPKVWDWINPILCVVAQGRKQRRNWMPSPTAPCITPTDRVFGLSIPPPASDPRKKDSLSSQGLHSIRSCILGWRPILLVPSSHRLNLLDVSPFPPPVSSLTIPCPPPARIEATISRDRWASHPFGGAWCSPDPINTPAP